MPPSTIAQNFALACMLHYSLNPQKGNAMAMGWQPSRYSEYLHGVNKKSKYTIK